MKKHFLFLLLTAFLVMGSGCAANQTSLDNIQDLFERSREKCGMLDCSKKFSVETQKASRVGSNMLQINGQIAMTGGAMAWWFEYGYGVEKDFSTVAFSTEPEILTGVGKKPVKVDIKKLEPNTKYYYRVVGFNEKMGRVDGVIRNINTVDPSCLGSGTLSAFAGTGMVAFGVATANPFLISGGVMVSSSAIFDEETFGNESDSRCKTVAGLLGGASGHDGGRAYKDAHKPKQQSNGNNNQSPPPNNNPPPNGNPPPITGTIGTGAELPPTVQ